MAFVALPEALQRLRMSEIDLKTLVKEEGIQVYQSDRDGQKVICFKEDEFKTLEKIRLSSSTEGTEHDHQESKLILDNNPADSNDLQPKASSLDLDLNLTTELNPKTDRSPESSARLDVDGNMSVTPFVPNISPDESLDLDLGEEDANVAASPNESLDLDLGEEDANVVASPNESLDLDLGEEDANVILDPDESLDLELGDNDELSDSPDESLDLDMDESDAASRLDSPSPESLLEETLIMDSEESFDNKDAFGSQDATLSIEDNDTLSFDDDGEALPFDRADNISLPDESFSIEEDADEALGLMQSQDTPETSRPTTEIVDEDEVSLLFPLMSFITFGIIIFNGMILFGMTQELGNGPGVAVGKNIFVTVKDLVNTNFPPPSE